MDYNLKSESEVREYINNLGIEYRFGCYSEKKPEVCHLLADFLESIKKDYEKAGKLYRTNCDDYKLPKSCLKYGVYALLGKGLHKADTKVGLDYLDKGCSLGNADACFNQGIMLISRNIKGVEQDVLKGMQMLEKACSAENAAACYHLSAMYIAGVRKFPNDEKKKNELLVQKDMKKAFDFALNACNFGNMYSCANVSQMYAKGEGVQQNKELSEQYKQKALEIQKEVQNANTLTFQEGLSS